MSRGTLEAAPRRSTERPRPWLAEARARWRETGRHRPPGFVALFGVVVVLNLVGLVMVLSASSVVAAEQYGTAWRFSQLHVAWFLLGLAVLAVSSRVDYRHWRRAVVPLLAVSLFLLAVVLVPGVGIRVSGSSRWLGFGPARMQPSEFAKLAMLIYAAHVLTRRGDRVDDWRLALKPVLLVLGAFVVLVMAQPDMGTTSVLVAIAGVVLFAGGVRFVHLGTVGGVVAAAGLVAAVSAPYRRARLLSFANPFADATGDGYQLAQSLIALGSGGWTGEGLGASRAKWEFLPNAHTDFIFAIVGEELGIVGAFLVIALFGAFLVLGVRTAIRAPDTFGSLLALGVTGWIVTQAVVNLGAVTGLLPVTGVPLPFVSFGGSALVAMMGGTGLLLNVARQGNDP